MNNEQKRTIDFKINGVPFWIICIFPWIVGVVQIAIWILKGAFGI